MKHWIPITIMLCSLVSCSIMVSKLERPQYFLEIEYGMDKPDVEAYLEVHPECDPIGLTQKWGMLSKTYFKCRR